MNRAAIASGAAAVAPVVFDQAQKGAGLVKSPPVIVDLLGYPVEAAVLAAAILGCVCARWSIAAGQAVRKQHRWSLDLPVSAMALAVSVVLMIKLRPEPWIALLLGGGAGVMGEGIFKIAEQRLRALGLLGDELPAKASDPG